MKNGRPLILILLAVMGLTYGIFYVSKKMSRQGSVKIDTRRVAVAIEDISFGQPLILKGKEAEGQTPNVDWHEMPTDMLIEGLVKDQAKLDEGLIAHDYMVKGELILESRVVSKDVFTFEPGSFVPLEFNADKNLIQLKALRPGVKVDLRNVRGGANEALAKCLDVFCLGAAPGGVPDPAVTPENASSLSVLIPMPRYVEFKNAIATYGAGLVAMPAESVCEGPQFPDKEETIDTAKALEALRAAESRRKAIESAVALAAEGNFAEAMVALRSGAGGEVAKLVMDWQDKQAAEILDRAEQAMEAGDHALVERVLAELDVLNEAAKRAGALRGKLATVRSGERTVENYTALLETIEGSIEDGAFGPAAEQLARLKGYADEGYDPGEAIAAPAPELERLNKELEERKREFELAKLVVKTFVGKGECDRAREKMIAIKKNFPKHEAVPDLEELVKNCGRGE